MKKIVFLGGGGGAMSVLPGLRDHFDVTAILSTFDDGGSYGRLRRDYKSPLSGDIRRAFSVLSTNELGATTEFRFPGGELEGHAFGNILLTSKWLEHGDVYDAMEELHRLFAVKGKVLGVSYQIAELTAELMDRTVVRGEGKIDEPHAKSHIRIQRVWVDPDPKPARGVLEAIAQADLIIMGPGDIYTSIIPCLLVEGVPEAIRASKAKTLYFCNRFTKHGQTNGFTAGDHLLAIEQYLQKRIDTVVLETSDLSEELVSFHADQQEKPVLYDIERLESAGYDIKQAKLLDGKEYEKADSDVLKRSKIRFAPESVGTLVKQLLGNL